MREKGRKRGAQKGDGVFVGGIVRGASPVHGRVRGARGGVNAARFARDAFTKPTGAGLGVVRGRFRHTCDRIRVSGGSWPLPGDVRQERENRARQRKVQERSEKFRNRLKGGRAPCRALKKKPGRRTAGFCVRASRFHAFKGPGQG